MEVLNDRLVGRLRLLYGDRADEVGEAIGELISRYENRIPSMPRQWSEKDALLILYGDSLLGSSSPLETLANFLRVEMTGLISFVHLLPFYPSTSDDGFAVADFRRVCENLGDWEQIESLAEDFRLVFDAVINHVSRSSLYAQGYFKGDPRYADFFIDLHQDTDTSGVFRTRSRPLLHAYDTHAGEKWLWTTFSSDQLDLNYANPQVLLEVLDVLLYYASKGASMVRLDAVPYLWKKLGTPCVHLPQTHEIIKLIRDIYDCVAPNVLLLTETNVPHEENMSYFGDRGDEAQVIYNFTLPPLIIWSLYKGDASMMSQWADSLPAVGPRATYLNITATHDGIGMRPTEGVFSEQQREELVKLARDRGGDVTAKNNGDGSISPYELNLSFFDAVNDPQAGDSLERQVERFLLSQSIPLVLMGIPGIYLQSLFGSRNDTEAVRLTGQPRRINRQQHHWKSLRKNLSQADTRCGKVWREYRRRLRLRTQLKALHPDSAQYILDYGPGVFAVLRENENTGERLLALHNVTAQSQLLAVTSYRTDLLKRKNLSGDTLDLSPYQVCWLV